MSNIIVFDNEYCNNSSIENVASYILKIELDDFFNDGYDLRYVGYGVNTLSLESMINSMMYIKRIYNKTYGKLLHHFVITIYRNRKTNIENNKMYAELIQGSIGNYLMNLGYQSICKIHINNNGIVHVHFMINSVNAFTGNKLTNIKAFYNQILRILKFEYKFLDWDKIIIYKKRYQ